MRKIYFVIIFSLFFCGCSDKEYEDPIVTNTYYEQVTTEEHSDNSENIDTYEENNQIDTEEDRNYDNGIFFDRERYNEMNVPVYFKTEKYGELVKEYTFFDSGCLFEAVDSEVSLKYLESADHIELFKETDSEEEHIIGWFDYRLVIDGYVYYLVSGNLKRSNLEGSDSEWLDFCCSNIKYKDGYLYYLYSESGGNLENLYRMKLDGTEKEQVSNFDSMDYCLTTNGAVHLIEYGYTMSIKYEEFGEDGEVTRLAEFDNEKYHDYQLIGMIDDTVYLSVMYARSIIDTEKVEIYALNDGNLELIHTSNDKSDIRTYKPFVHGDYIYYRTAEGMFELNPKDGSCVMIAEAIFAFVKIY